MNDETWRDQYKRASRSANLVIALSDGAIATFPPRMFDPADAVFHFCTDAFHLRDWIAAAGVDREHFDNDRAFEAVLKARITQLDRELFKRSPELAACRDIANGYKHLKLTGPSFLPGGEHSEVVGRAFEVDFSKPQQPKSTYTVQIGVHQIEAQMLAKGSMARWDVWFASSSSIASELRAEVKARPWIGWGWEPQPWGITREMDFYPITDSEIRTHSGWGAPLPCGLVSLTPTEEPPEHLAEAEPRDVQAIAAALPEAPSTSTAPPAHPVDRLTTISVAVIAVIGVLLGGLVAAASAWWTASVSSDSNQSIELDKFRRQEVEKAYLAYITDIQEFARRAAAVAVAFSSRDTPDYPIEFRDQVSALLKASRDVDSSSHLISLVGSKQIREAVKDMKKRAGDLTETAAFALKPWYDKAKDHKQEIDKNTREFYLAYNPLDNEIQEVIAAMRNDLGIADQRR